MKHLSRYLLALLLLACFGTASADGPAPDFTLTSTDGKNVKLSELKGQVVMINFWASWCGPCRQEMPLLDTLYQRFAPVGFTLLGVNVDKRRAQAEELLKDVPVSFPILFDTDNRVSRLYEVQAMPTTVLVDRDGKARYVHHGYLPGDELEYEKQVQALLQK